MAGPLPDEAVERHRASGRGQPVHGGGGAARTGGVGCLVADRQTGWRVEPLAMADVQSSRHAAAFLARRIELLPETTLKLLSVGQCWARNLTCSPRRSWPGKLHRKLSPRCTRHSNGISSGPKATDDRCAFIHDKLRETLLDRLPENERRELHLRAAVDLEAEAPERVYDLAYHFDAAGESQRALPYALAAAEQARNQHALELAEEQYRIAERGVPDTDEAIRYRIAEGLGDVLMLRGHYRTGSEDVRSCKPPGKRQFDAAQIQGNSANSPSSKARTTLDRGSGTVAPIVGPKNPIPVRQGFLLFLAGRCSYSLQTMFPKLFLAHRSLKAPIRSCWPLTCMYICTLFFRARKGPLFVDAFAHQSGRTVSAHTRIGVRVGVPCTRDVLDSVAPSR